MSGKYKPEEPSSDVSWCVLPASVMDQLFAHEQFERGHPIPLQDPDEIPNSFNKPWHVRRFVGYRR